MTIDLRLKNRSDLRLFTASITVFVMLSVNTWDSIYMAPEVFHETRLGSNAAAAVLSAVLAYFVGSRMLRFEELSRELEYQANYDALTKTMTRARFYQRCEIEAETLFPAVLLVLDIDFFKQVNDRYGHAAGDQALRHVAHKILRNCRASDLVARFGGEEFVILVQGATELNGLGVAERIRRRIEASPVKLDDNEVRVTVSIGAALASAPKYLDVAVRQADAALYAAKNGGRNRTCAATPDLPGPPVRKPISRVGDSV